MESPLFLLAPPRSYTSIVNAMIGQHPQAFGLPELNLFNFEILRGLWQTVSDEVGFDSNRRHGLLRTIAELYAGEQSSAAIVMAEHWAAARQDNSTASVFSEIMAQLDPLFPVEKSPAYTMNIKRLERIYQAFPDARFIHLVRHPITQCQSVMQLNDGVFALFINAINYDGKQSYIDPQIAWHDLNINIIKFLEQVPQAQQMRIRGEEIMEFPRKILVKICRWLGIRDDDFAIDSMMHPEKSPFACLGPVTAMFGNDPKFLKKPIFRQHIPRLPSLNRVLKCNGRKLNSAVVSLAQEFGYG